MYNNNGTYGMPPLNVTTASAVVIPEGCVLSSTSDGSGYLGNLEMLIIKLKSAVFIPLLFLFGPPTNVVNMIVFFKQGLHDRVNLCLFSLAIVDFTVVSFYFVIYAEHIFMFTSPDMQGVVDTFLTNNKAKIFYSSSNGSMILSVIIALERCVCVLMPLRARTLLTTKHMAAIILTTVPVACLLRLVVTAKYAAVCFFDPRRQQVFMGLYVTDYASRNKELLDFIDGIVYGFIIALGCPLVVFIATVITVVKLWQSAAWRKLSSSTDTRKEMAVTKMLVMLSLVTVILRLPSIGLRIYPLFNVEFSANGIDRNLFLASVSFGEIFLCVESSFSFILYYSASSKYRKTCKGLFRKRCLSKYIVGMKCMSRKC